MKSVVIILFVLISISTFAQQINTDSVLTSVRESAAKENYDLALNKLEALIQAYPEDKDYLIYKARILSWKKEYSEAIQILEPICKEDIQNLDASGALLNVYYWSNLYEKCINQCSDFLEIDSLNVPVLVKQAVSYEQLNNDVESLLLINKIFSIERDNVIAEGLRVKIEKKKKNKVSFSYLHTVFDQPTTTHWHLWFLEYSRKIKNATIVGRSNIAYQRQEVEAQFEIDYYQKVRKRSLLYTNFGVSTDVNIFPIYRLGAEYYFPKFSRFTTSFGARYLHFINERVLLLTSKNTVIFNRYEFGYRPYYEVKTSLLSHSVWIQKSNELKERYLRFVLQYGSVPYLYLYNQTRTQLNTTRVGVSGQFRIKYSIFVRPVVFYEYEEFLPKTHRNRLNAQIIISKRF